MSGPAKRKALGRGLAALIPEPEAPPLPTPSRATEVPTSALEPNPFQPRTAMDKGRLAELTASILESGIVQPILVRRRGERYQIIAGERRYRAAQAAGLATVPVTVREVADEHLLELALVENIQREELNALEEAQGFKRLIDEFGLTHDAVAKAVGRSRSAVSNLLRLTHLPKPVQDYLMDGALDMGHARALLALPAAQQTATAVRVVNGKLSVRETERLVHALANPPARAPRKSAAARDADTVRLETELAETLGAKVAIEPRGGGRGRIVIGYSSLDELDGILAKLRPRD